jgi:prepilin signal peptidase PulO-like enzyme (type II secretory pathway)
VSLALQYAAGLAAAVAAGGLAGYGAVFLFNKIPAKWLCDHDETPDERHLPPRLARYPWAPLFSLVFAAAVFKAGLFSPPYAAAMLPALGLLLLAGLSDKKYRIIPDQFVMMLAVTGIGFAALSRDALSPLLGLLAGGGLFFLCALIGRLAAKKDVLGLGDVKLMAVCGVITGLSGVVTIMILTALSSAVVFFARIAAGSLKRTDEEPLGPFIAVSAAVYLIFSREIAHLLGLYLTGGPL